jgi:hypothetical protein
MSLGRTAALAGELSGALKQHTRVGFKGGKQLAPLASLILRWIPCRTNDIFASNVIDLKRVNPATTWSTRPSPYANRHMFSPLTHWRLSAVNQLVNAPLGLPAPGPVPPAARSSSSSESSGMMHPLAAALPAPSQRLAPARIAAGWIAAGSGPSPLVHARTPADVGWATILTILT